MEKGVVVDGARPSVEWVTSLPRGWRVTPSERLILLTLACDAFDWESAPGFEAIAAWTGMQRTSCIEILGRLCEATDVRPALLDRVSVRGRRRTIWRLMGDMTGQREPVGHADRLRDAADASDDPEPSANRSAAQNGSGSPTVGEPVGHADRLQPSANQSAPPTGYVPDDPLTVGEPSANRSATPTAPLPLTQEQEQESKPRRGKPRTTKAPKPSVSVPDDFTVTAEMRAWAAEKRLTVDIDAATDEFINHHRAKGTIFRDWTAGWRTWMLRTRTYGGPQAGATSSHPTGPRSRHEIEQESTDRMFDAAMARARARDAAEAAERKALNA